MYNLSIVVEGRDDAELLRNVLPTDELTAVRFFAAGGRISLSTVARNILVHEGTPVLLVMDADTLNPDSAEEARQYTKAMISHVANQVPADVFSFMPEIEVIFFEAPEVLAAALGRQLEKAELLQGITSPKRTLGLLLKQAGGNPAIADLLTRMDANGIDFLHKGKQMAAFIEAFQRLLEGSRVLAKGTA